MDEDMELAHYMEIGAVELEGMDENGEMIFSITEKAKELAPELWDAHMRHVEESLMTLYANDLVNVEYDENLEAKISIKPEGYKLAKELGLIEYDKKETPDN